MPEQENQIEIIQLIVGNAKRVYTDLSIWEAVMLE